jgi:hypothetical protein
MKKLQSVNVTFLCKMDFKWKSVILLFIICRWTLSYFTIICIDFFLIFSVLVYQLCEFSILSHTNCNMENFYMILI